MSLNIVTTFSYLKWTILTTVTLQVKMRLRALTFLKVISILLGRGLLSIQLARGRFLDSRQVYHMHTRQGNLLASVVKVDNLADLGAAD